METEKLKIEKMEKLFTGNSDFIKEQFIFSGLLLTIFERFKKYVIKTLDGFYADGHYIDKGELRYVRSDEFKKLVEEKGSKTPGQHNNKEFRASLMWFLENNAITEDEFKDVERLYNLRNEIGHELLEIILDDEHTPITLWDVLITFQIYVKITRWWFNNIEANINPEFDKEGYKGSDLANVDSFETIFLREILNQALEGNPSWDEFKNTNG